MMRIHHHLDLRAFLCVILAAACGGTGSGALSAAEPVDGARLKAAREKGIEFLRVSQAADGSWTTNRTPGISGLVIAALLDSGAKVDDPTVAKALQHLETYIQKDGGIYSPKSDLRNYETCIAVLALRAANADGRFDKTIAAARYFLKQLAWDDADGVKPDDVKFGGAGYGSSSRPDLSNTAYLLDALKAAGLSKEDPAFQNALVFVSRCQNLESQFNTLPQASKVNDGGFYYTPAAGGNSGAGKGDDDSLRSYGTMTYAGLKSMVYAGVGPDDPRVVAAVKWIRSHYSISENPGMGQAGLYYYFHTFAKALDAMELVQVTDEKGREHNWRAELGAHLLSLQKPNGSWVNSEKRWMEGDPNLSTAFALLALSYCDPEPAKSTPAPSP